MDKQTTLHMRFSVFVGSGYPNEACQYVASVILILPAPSRGEQVPPYG